MLRFIHQNIPRINQNLLHLIISNLPMLKPAFGLLLTTMILQFEEKHVWMLAMGPLFIFAVSLSPGRRTEVCWKGNCKPIVYQRRRWSAVLRMRHPEKSHQHFRKHILKLNTNRFIYRGHDTSCKCRTQMAGYIYEAGLHGFSTDTSRWATQAVSLYSPRRKKEHFQRCELSGLF